MTGGVRDRRVAVFFFAAFAACSPTGEDGAGLDSVSWLELSPSVGASWFATGWDFPDDPWPGPGDMLVLDCFTSPGAEAPPRPCSDAPDTNRPGTVGEVERSLELLVLWRGSPGWFRRPLPGSGRVSFDDVSVFSRPEGNGGDGTAVRIESRVAIEQGGVTLELRFDAENATVYVQGQRFPLDGDNVILVDDVDGAGGPQVTGALRIDPEFTVTRFAEPRFSGGIELLLRRSQAMLDFLRCDVPLPADPASGDSSESLAQRHMDALCARYWSPLRPVQTR